jgi:predicted membrane metal-binding protein
MKHKAENYFGWYGVLAILLAYLLLSFNVIVSKSLSYQLLNLTGALGVIVEAMSKKDAQPAVLNGAWAAIAILAIVRIVIS